jgi:hypothetical protein
LVYKPKPGELYNIETTVEGNHPHQKAIDNANDKLTAEAREDEIEVEDIPEETEVENVTDS